MNWRQPGKMGKKRKAPVSLEPAAKMTRPLLFPKRREGGAEETEAVFAEAPGALEKAAAEGMEAAAEESGAPASTLPEEAVDATVVAEGAAGAPAGAGAEVASKVL